MAVRRKSCWLALLQRTRHRPPT